MSFLYVLLIVLSLAVLGLLLFNEFLWTELKKKDTSIIVDQGRHEGEARGEPDVVKHVCNPGDVLFVNIHTGDQFLRVYSVKVLECRTAQVLLETTTWNEGYDKDST